MADDINLGIGFDVSGAEGDESEIEKQIDEAMKEHPAFSEKDLEDLVGAANTMLKDRGVTPMKLNKALKNKFSRSCNLR